jgi:hypothetical protein
MSARDERHLLDLTPSPRHRPKGLADLNLGLESWGQISAFETTGRSGSRLRCGR